MMKHYGYTARESIAWCRLGFFILFHHLTFLSLFPGLLLHDLYHFFSFFFYAYRICRPGSVVGPQQQYLISIESRMKSDGELFRIKNPNHSASFTPIPMVRSYDTILFCVVLRCIIIQRNQWYWIEQHSSVQFSIVHFTLLSCTSQNMLYRIIPHIIA